MCVCVCSPICIVCWYKMKKKRVKQDVFLQLRGNTIIIIITNKQCYELVMIDNIQATPRKKGKERKS